VVDQAKRYQNPASVPTGTVNWFSVLANIDNNDAMDSVYTAHKEAYIGAAESTTGFKRGKRKERWITDNTWKAIDERQRIKVKKEQLISAHQESILHKHHERIQRQESQAKKWVEDKLQEAESAALKGDSKTPYPVSGKNRPQYRHNFDKCRHSFVIFGMNHPDTSV